MASANSEVRITALDKTGREHQLVYRVEDSLLMWRDTRQRVSLQTVGRRYVQSSEPWAHHIQANVHPGNPGRKSGEKRLVKIQLGLQCNFSCDYCAQKADLGDAKKVFPIRHMDKAPHTDDVASFLDNLPNWLIAQPDVRFELWGGEPFVYWKAFRPLADGLLARYPAAVVSTVTNGSLIDEEISEWISRNDRIQIVVSHDGPGKYRDKDVLLNPHLRDLFHRLQATGRSMIFNCVLSLGNASIPKIKAYIAEGLGVDEGSVELWSEGLLTPHDEQSMALVPDRQIISDIFFDIVSNPSQSTYRPELEEFLDRIAMAAPANTIAQKCGLDRSDSIVVNLKSQRVVTCQNTLPVGKHDLGHVSQLEDVRMTTVHHWRSRPQCGSCPVLVFCKGSCLYLEDRAFDAACQSQLTYRLPFLCAAIYFITGLVPDRIEWEWDSVKVDLFESVTASQLANA